MDKEIHIDQDELLHFIVTESSLVEEFKKHQVLRKLNGDYGRDVPLLNSVHKARSDMSGEISRLRADLDREKYKSQQLAYAMQELITAMQKCNPYMEIPYNITSKLENVRYG